MDTLSSMGHLNTPIYGQTVAALGLDPYAEQFFESLFNTATGRYFIIIDGDLADITNYVYEDGFNLQSSVGGE